MPAAPAARPGWDPTWFLCSGEQFPDKPAAHLEQLHLCFAFCKA